ncbi:cytochrome P450 [Auricularia subglabra TFB-10046 SS5]|nr:cytochrome P450 [Auricularia subglabra TFB-10046 SS5]
MGEEIGLALFGGSGDLIHLRNYSRHVIVLNSERAIRDLIVRRADIYSDRPQTTMYCDLVGRGKTVFSSNHGERFRQYSRLLHQALSKTAIRDYQSAQDDATNRMLKSMLLNPDSFAQHIRTCAGRIIMRVAYGYELKNEEDYYISLVQQSISLGNEAFKPGRWLVDSFPLLRHVPSWFPAAGFKKWAAEARSKLDEMTRAPHDMVKAQMAAGTAPPSFTSRNLVDADGNPVSPDKEEAVAWVSAALYVGAADTTVAALSTFILMMVRHPDVQLKGQREIDAVLGATRLPALDDRQRLPYVEAVMKECMRECAAEFLVTHRLICAPGYNTIGPLALGHSLRREDKYDGYTLPKGSTVYMNLWAVTRDESLYPSPETFRPERFIPDEKGAVERDPWDIVFGFGLRRCPGRHLADATLFLAIAKMLAAFSFRPEQDARGNGLVPPEEWTSGPNCGPKAFRCRILPRSEDMKALVVNSARDV